MARRITPLTDTFIKNAKALKKPIKDENGNYKKVNNKILTETTNKNYTLSDGNGLQLLIKIDGTKLWEFIYRSPTETDTKGNLKRRKTSFGTYPKVGLGDRTKIEDEYKGTARGKRDEYLKLINRGIDPLEQKKEDKEKKLNDNTIKKNTFEIISLKWWESYKDEVSENYHNKLLRALELYTYPYIGKKPITDIKRLDLIAILEDLKSKDLKETANRTFMILTKVFKYAVTYELIPHNITADIDKKDIIGKKVEKNYPTFTKHSDIKGLLLSIKGYNGEVTTQKALEILPYLFVRSSNIRHMQWDEIDLKKELWIIPSHKMKVKTRGDFYLPLPKQVIPILEELKKYYGDDGLIFPSVRSKISPMSDNTLISALRRMGYTKEELVPHSFRSIFSTISYEYQNKSLEDKGHNYSSEVIEALLSHQEKNKVKSAYNRAEYIEAKRGLIQWYANFLDDLVGFK